MCVFHRKSSHSYSHFFNLSRATHSLSLSSSPFFLLVYEFFWSSTQELTAMVQIKLYKWNNHIAGNHVADCCWCNYYLDFVTFFRFISSRIQIRWMLFTYLRSLIKVNKFTVLFHLFIPSSHLLLLLLLLLSCLFNLKWTSFSMNNENNNNNHIRFEMIQSAIGQSL